MKGISALIMIAILILSLAACNEAEERNMPSGDFASPSEPAQAEESNQNEVSSLTTEPMNKIMVVYFSCTGNTRSLAEHMSDVLNATLYEITPKTPYTSDDLNWSDKSSRSQIEQNDESARPAISGTAANIDGYETIFLGYPIWNGIAPRIIYSFLESCDFSGKTIIPFCTSGSSGIGLSAINLQRLVDDTAIWLPGACLPIGATRDDVAEWISSLDLDLHTDNPAVKIEQSSDTKEGTILYIKIRDLTLTATLVNNQATQVLKELLAKNPFTVNMSDYGDFEKVGSLGISLPTSDDHITSEPGDLLLYQGNQLVIFYAPNAWSYTRLGRIDDVTQTELKKALGTGDVTVTLSLTQ